MKYIIPDIPPSNNKYIGRNARFEYQAMKKHWAELIWCFCIPRPNAPINKSVVKIKYYFPDKRRRDPDNYSGKMILDGLRTANIITDDSFSNITLLLSAEFGCDSKRTEIEVIEDDMS